MKTPLSCHAINNDLKAFLDGELSPVRRFAVQFHLRQCALCRAEVETMTQISRDLQTSETPSILAPELRQRILQNLPNAPTGPSLGAPSHAVSSRKMTPQLMQYGLAFCLVALMVASTLSLTGRRVSNTFNAASEQMADGYGSSSAAPESAPMADEYADSLSKSENNSMTRSASETGGKPQRLAKNQIADYQRRAEPRLQSRQRMPQTGGASSSTTSRDTSNLPAALRRVHKEARLTVGVDDIEAKSAMAEQSVRAAGGYIVSNDLNTGADNRKYARLELRVPVGRFEGIVSELSQLGEVRAKQVTGQDITEQFSDSQQAKNVLTSELTTRELQLKEVLARIEAARNKKKYMADPWELRAEVRRLRIEASQARARLELMRKLSELSAITLELKEKSLTPTGGFSQELNETFAGAGETFLAAARLPLKLLIWAFAYSPLWLPLVIAFRLLSRRMSSRDVQGNLQGNLPQS